MREIKFRCWDYDFNIWIPEESIIINKGKPIAIIHNTNLPIEEALETKETKGKLTNPNWELMQFTGLKDKNGKEIYEGDILKDVDQDNGRHYNSIVEFFEGMFRAISFTNSTNSYPAGMENMEIVGNFYENPELLLKEEDNRKRGEK